jgi:excisionase family DNA binding protein
MPVTLREWVFILIATDQSLKKRVFNPFEAAKVAHVGHNRIREWVRAGTLRALPGRRILIPESALEEFLQSARRDKNNAPCC